MNFSNLGSHSPSFCVKWYESVNINSDIAPLNITSAGEDVDLTQNHE